MNHVINILAIVGVWTVSRFFARAMHRGWVRTVEEMELKEAIRARAELDRRHAR